MIVPNEDEGLNKRRHAMPQIANWEEFKKDVEAQGCTMVSIKIDPNNLKPTQGNFNKSKVETMVQQYKEGIVAKFKPIVVSRDGYIVDGHHRWLAQVALRNKKPIEAVQVDMDIDDVLQLVADKPYIEHKKISESADLVRAIRFVMG